MADIEPPKQPVVVPPLMSQEEAEQANMLADMAKRREEEAAIAKIQDAALDAVRAQCDAERQVEDSR